MLGGQLLLVPALFLLFFPVASLGSGNGSRSLSLHLLLVQVVQVVADGVQGLGVEREWAGRCRGRTAIVALLGLLLLLLLAQELDSRQSVGVSDQWVAIDSVRSGSVVLAIAAGTQVGRLQLVDVGFHFDGRMVASTIRGLSVGAGRGSGRRRVGMVKSGRRQRAVSLLLLLLVRCGSCYGRGGQVVDVSTIRQQ